jgi:hypothetical protein
MVSKHTLKKKEVKAHGAGFERWGQGYEIYDLFSMALYIILNSFFSFYMIRYYFGNEELSNIQEGVFLGIASFTWLFMAARWGVETVENSIRDKQFNHIVSWELTKIIITSLLSGVIYLNMMLNSDKFFNTNIFLILLAIALNICKFLELADKFAFRQPKKSPDIEEQTIIESEPIPDATIADIQKQIAEEPIKGAKALIDYLQKKKEWEDKQNEVLLKSSQLEDIQKRIDRYGPTNDLKAEKNETIHYLLRICSEIKGQIIKRI